MAAEHDQAVADARAALAGRGPQPLQPLPSRYAATRLGLHRVSEDLLMPKRVKETGHEIALCFVPGGVGMLEGYACFEGTELITGDGQRGPATDLAAGAALLGVDPPATSTVEIEADAAAAVALWFAFGTVVLADLIAASGDDEADPIRLWPEHFDVGTTLGSEADGSRANYGASPGDEDHAEPYLYVGPWVEQTGDDSLWNATGFAGAELGYADLIAAEDQYALAAEFLAARLAALRT